MKLNQELIKNSIKRMDFDVKSRVEEINQAKKDTLSEEPPKKILPKIFPKLDTRKKEFKAITGSRGPIFTAVIPPFEESGAGASPIGQEKIIFENDLMMVNYLERGLLAAKSVAKIHIKDKDGNPHGAGTGSIIAGNYMLTNNHVLPDKETAKNSTVEFNYQLDYKGDPLTPIYFQIKPDKFFETNEKLDFTVVAISEKSKDKKTSLSKIGPLSIDKDKENYIRGKCLSIIQHPNGELKQVAIRENQLIDVKDDFIWYQTDTTPGSSGAPVFNDNWRLVALHHSGVPKTDKDGNYITVDGKHISPKTKGLQEDDIRWEANEGIKITEIINYLVKKYPKDKTIQKLKQ